MIIIILEVYNIINEIKIALLEALSNSKGYKSIQNIVIPMFKTAKQFDAFRQNGNVIDFINAISELVDINDLFLPFIEMSPIIKEYITTQKEQQAEN